MIKLKDLVKEGPQRDRNNLASYIIDLNNMLNQAKLSKNPKAKSYIKIIQKDLKDTKKKLEKLKNESINENKSDKKTFDKVVEAITRRGFMEIKGQAKYLMDSAKNLMRAIKNQNDLTTKEEVEYIHSKSKLMMDLLKDKRYNESVNELTTNQVIATQVMVAMQRCDKIIKDLIKNDVAKRDKKKALELMKLYKKHFVEFSAKAKAANPLED